ncbi:MAG: aldehyde dehydrogenase family protein, partial [Minisyncoccia bacterium]
SIVKKISFTGSTYIGKKLMALCADRVKRLSLELGGNAPFIIFPDADLNKAIKGLMESKFRASGQTCVCANRVFVHEDIYSKVVELLKNSVATLKCGNGMDEDVDQGPIINDEAIKNMEFLMWKSVKQGAKIVTGGRRDGQCFQPTIITNVTMGMDIAIEEVFGPVLSLISFKNDTEVIKMANDTAYGLASYLFSEDLRRAWHVAEQLEYGMVAINEGILSTAVAPFGGIKESGFGREGSYMGIEEYLNVKYVLAGGVI